jgi:polyhydroxybutyrate depolymerase
MFRSTLISAATALAALVLPLASAVPAAAQQQRGTIMHWTIDGVRRDALVFAPHGTQGATKRPLVIAFHGHGGRVLSTSTLMHIQTLWPQAIVVYPQGLNTPTPLDPAGTSPGWQAKAGDFGDRDLRLFDRIVATMKRSRAVDERRIFVTGFSNGAVFSLLLWAERASTIAAVAEVAGRLDPAETLTLPRRLLAVAGRRDSVAPFAVQKRTIERARRINRASGTGSPCGRYCTLYPSAIGPFPVETIIHPGGHVYPSWASIVIVRFFNPFGGPDEPTRPDGP